MRLGSIAIETPRGNIIANSGGIVQVVIGARPQNTDASIKLTAGSTDADGTVHKGNIEAQGSGVIGKRISLDATGDIKGVAGHLATGVHTAAHHQELAPGVPDHTADNRQVVEWLVVVHPKDARHLAAQMARRFMAKCLRVPSSISTRVLISFGGSRITTSYCFPFRSISRM